MKTSLDFKAYYADTDSYGVVWHGTYLRWFEAGRIEFLNKCGISIDKIKDEQKIILPVREINVNYKASAVNGDEMTVFTEIAELKPHYVTFLQTIKEKNGEKIFTTAAVKCVGVDENGRLIRTMEEFFKKKIGV